MLSATPTTTSDGLLFCSDPILKRLPTALRSANRRQPSRVDDGDFLSVGDIGVRKVAALDDRGSQASRNILDPQAIAGEAASLAFARRVPRWQSAARMHAGQRQVTDGANAANAGPACDAADRSDKTTRDRRPYVFFLAVHET